MRRLVIVTCVVLLMAAAFHAGDIIKADRFVVFNDAGQPVFVATVGSSQGGELVVYDASGTETFAVHRGKISAPALDRHIQTLVDVQQRMEATLNDTQQRLQMAERRATTAEEKLAKLTPGAVPGASGAIPAVRTAHIRASGAKYIGQRVVMYGVTYDGVVDKYFQPDAPTITLDQWWMKFWFKDQRSAGRLRVSKAAQGPLPTIIKAKASIGTMPGYGAAKPRLVEYLQFRVEDHKGMRFEHAFVVQDQFSDLLLSLNAGQRLNIFGIVVPLGDKDAASGYGLICDRIEIVPAQPVSNP